MRILTLVIDIDTLETYFDSHVDLLQRKLQKHSDRLKMKAEEKFKIKDLSGDLLAENLEREIKNVKLKVRLLCCFAVQTRSLTLGRFVYQAAARMSSFLTTWQSAQVVRTREKLSFFFGVSNLLFTALMFGLAPQCVIVHASPITGIARVA